jgi:hypothetical protein
MIRCSPPRRASVGRLARARVRATDGQATIEVVAVLPLVLLLGVAMMAMLAGRSASEAAAAAAHAGAMALIQGDDAKAAARAAIPGREASIDVRSRRVRVVVRPPLRLPFAPDLLTGRAAADAGPEPAP